MELPSEPSSSTYNQNFAEDELPSAPTVKELPQTSQNQAEECINRDPTVVASTSTYCKNFMGVDILPEIPEEDEFEEDINCIENVKIGLKRFSTISAKFEDLINNENQNIYCMLDPTRLHILAEQTHFQNSQSTFRNAWQNYGCCSPYQKYIFRKKIQCIKDFLYHNLFKPLYCALTTASFYPSLLSKTVTTYASTVFIVIIPYVSVLHTTDQFLYFISSESALLLTLISFGWLCFLIFLPWIVNARKTKLKVLFLIGLMCFGASSLGIYISLFKFKHIIEIFHYILVLKYELNHDLITISCLLFGVGFGMVGCTEESVYREVIGTRRWKRVDSTLDVSTGICVILIYYIIYETDADIVFIMRMSHNIYTFLILMWIIWYAFDSIIALIMRFYRSIK